MVSTVMWDYREDLLAEKTKAKAKLDRISRQSLRWRFRRERQAQRWAYWSCEYEHVVERLAAVENFIRHAIGDFGP